MNPTTAKGTETLAYKQSVLQGLVNTLGLHQRTMTEAELEKVEAIRYGVHHRIAALIERSMHEEIDLKITAIREEIAVLKA